MKTEKNIGIAFLLNLAFAVFEFFGGVFTGSVAILSDAVHDLADAGSIGISWALEKKSSRPPDAAYTLGYGRYSVLGSFLTTAILLIGSGAVLWKSVLRILHPAPIRYDAMIGLAVIGVAVNLAAAWFTREGDSVNQKAVNLHMLEDVLGWAVVLVGAVVMRFTKISVIDPLMSVGVAVFVLFHCVKNLREIGSIFLEKAPEELDVSELRSQMQKLAGVQQVQELHLWSMDGQNHWAAVCVATTADIETTRQAIRKLLKEHGICHVTVELNRPGEE